MNSRGRTREFVQADRGERQLNKFLEALAVVDAAGDLPFGDLVATDGVRLNRNDTLVAISADDSPSWAAALQMLQRRGVNSIAVVLDGAYLWRTARLRPAPERTDGDRHTCVSHSPRRSARPRLERAAALWRPETSIMNASAPGTIYACARYHCPAGSGSQVRSHRPGAADDDRDLGHQCRRRQGNLRPDPAHGVHGDPISGGRHAAAARRLGRRAQPGRPQARLAAVGGGGHGRNRDSISRCFSRACR